VFDWTKTFHRGQAWLGRFLIIAGDNGQVAGGGQAAHAGDGHNGLAESCQARDGQLAGFLEHVKRHNQEGNYRKPDGENREGGEQLANEVELRQDQHDEK